MDINIIRLHHFYDKRAYCKLQEYFGSYDYKRNYEEKIEEPYDDLTIVYHDLDEFSQEEFWHKKNFKKDFLLLGIENIGKNYIERFNIEINKRSLFTQDLIDGFAKHYQNKLVEIKGEVLKSKLLDNSIKMKVIAQVLSIEKYAMEFFSNPYPKIKQKIQVNWNRTRLIYLFHLLRHNKQIAWIEDNDLGRIIDSVFEYQSPIKTNEYIACKDTRKHLNAFKNNSGRTENKANTELKNIFMNEDFFNV